MNTFFEEITACLSKAAVKYENVIIMGDFNIAIENKRLGYGKLNSFRNMFNEKSQVYN